LLGRDAIFSYYFSLTLYYVLDPIKRQINTNMTRIRDSNTMELIEKRPRPELPRWYRVTDVGTNKTYIGKDGRSEKEKKFWEEMDYLNEDKGRLDRTRKDKRSVVSSLCSRLRLGKRMKEHIVETADRINAKKVNYVGGIRAVAIGTIAYFVNQRRQRQPGFKYEDRIENDEEFNQLAERLDVEMYDAISGVQRAINEGTPPVSAKKRHEQSPTIDEPDVEDRDHDFSV